MNDVRTAQGIVAPTAARVGVAPHWVAFALLGAAVLIYLPELRALAVKWDSSEELSHGYLVALVVPVLFWLQRGEVTLGRMGSPLAVGGLLITTIAWALARGANVDLIGWMLLPAVLWFALWTALGSEAARSLLFPVAYFLLAVPVWNLVLTPVLQAITVEASTLLLGIAGVQAYIEGAFVQVPAGNFEIAGGCSGMNFLIVGVATGALFAFVERLPWRRTALVMLAAVAIAMLANWIRVTYVIYAGNASNMQSPLVDDHATFGWYVFAVAMVPFFLFARRVARGAPLPSAVRRERSGVSAGRAISAFLVGVACLGFGAAWAALVDARAGREAAPVLQFPTVTNWAGPGLAEPDWHPGFPGAAATSLVGYRRGDVVVDAFAAFYAAQSEAQKLIGYHSSVAGSERWTEKSRTVVTLGDGKPALEHMLVDADGGQRIVWSWYEVRGERLTGALAVKTRESLRTVGLAPRSGVVALSARCVPDCEAARVVMNEAYDGGLSGANAGTAAAK